MKLIDRIILSRFIQKENPNNRNRAAFLCLRELGFSLPAVRGGLIKMNGITVAHLAKDKDITAPSIYAAAYGIRQNMTGRAILAEALGIDVKELFPDEAPADG